MQGQSEESARGFEPIGQDDNEEPQEAKTVLGKRTRRDVAGLSSPSELEAYAYEKEWRRYQH